MNESFAVLLIPINFVGIFILGSFVISRLGGWHTLQNRFPYTNQSLKGRKFIAQTFWLNPLGRYSHMTKVIVTKNGMYLKPSILGALFHKPVFIPFKACKEMKFDRMLHRHRARINIGYRWVSLWGKSADYLKEHHS